MSRTVGGAVELSVLVAVVLLTFVWVPRVVHWWSLRQALSRARTFLLEPAGLRRPVNLDEAGQAITAVLDMIGSRRHAGLVVHRFTDDHTVRVALTVYRVRNPAHVASRVAAAVGATAVEAPDLRLPSPGRVWYARRYDYRGRDPHDLQLPPLTEAASWLTKQIGSMSGSVCLSVVAEPTRRWESMKLRDWHNVRAGRRDEQEGTGFGRACRMRMVAWADDDADAQLLVAGTPGQLHRWPFTVRARLVTSMRSWVATGVALGTAAAVGAVSGTVGVLVGAVRRVTVDGWQTPEVAAMLSPTTRLLALAAGALVAVGLVAWRVAGGPNVAQRHYRRLHSRGLVPVDRPIVGSPLIWLKSFAVHRANPRDLNKRLEGQQRSVAYPYRVATLVCNAHHLAQLTSFPEVSDTAAARAETADVPAPAAVAEGSRDTTLGDGSLLGADSRGRPVRLLDRDRRSGLFVTGDPGAGKTVGLLRLFSQDARARRERVRRDGQMAMLWMETKGEGADQAEEVLTRSAGYPPSGYVRLDVTAPSGPRLELLDRSNPELSAARLVGAFTYAFETGSVGPRAAEAMRAAFTVALRTTPDVAEAAMLGRAWPNVLWLATVLMGGDPASGAKKRLLDAFQQAARLDLHTRTGQWADNSHRGDDSHKGDGQHDPLAADERSAGAAGHMPASGEQPGPAAPTVGPSSGSAMWDAWRAWDYYESHLPPRQFTELFESPRNKLTAISQASTLWTPAAERDDITLAALLRHRGVAILNFGSSRHGRVDEMTASRLAAITLYLLWEQIKADCAGWLERDISVGVYADELSHLSGTGSGNDVIGQMFDKGRAFGVQLALATQRFDQLPQRTRQAALGFGTRLYMTTENIDNAEAAAVDLNGGPDGLFSARDLRELPVGVAATRMRFAGAGQPPFTLHLRLPDDDQRSQPDRHGPVAALTAGGDDGGGQR